MMTGVSLFMQVALKLCGLSKGGQGQKITCWWDDPVKKSVKEERRNYKKWQKCSNSKSKELYLAKKKRLRKLWLSLKK